MKFLLTGFSLFLLITGVQAQGLLRTSIQNSEKEPLPGATLTWNEGASTVIADSAGLATLTNITNGSQTFTISHVSYKAILFTLTFPLPADSLFIISLLPEEENEEEVVVRATRTSRTMAATPTRIEIISGEELAEKGNMKPGDIRMLLNESTGIQTQQTSATSYNAGIRIQGLDGRYTQLLRDGYPLYAGFSGGLSLLQIAPLDLRQVEVVKGSASTLYGGGAIAGLVNLVSKTPGENRELTMLANATSAVGLDLNGFYSERYGKAGMTIFTSRNSTAPYDPAAIGLTAIPKSSRYTLHPRLFLYGKNTSADMGVSYITEKRIGGSVAFIRKTGAGYFEQNNTHRVTTQVGVSHRLGNQTTLQAKNSFTFFNRRLTIPSYSFDALQKSSFTELTLTNENERTAWVLGINLVTDDLQQRRPTSTLRLDYHYTTWGLFAQNTWSATSRLTVETGLRGDFVNEYGFEWLPRFSALYRLSPHLTTRLGGGVGYKTPTPFTEETERIQFQGLLPINKAQTRNERSVGANWDITYRTQLGSLTLSLNHLFFYTRLANPLTLIGAPGGKIELLNANGYLDTKGTETNLRVVYHHFKLFVGYTYTNANTHFSANKTWLPLTARHRLNNVLMYEIEDNLKLGLEGYYYSQQKLSDGTTGKPYWITGFMAEKLWEKFSVFLNFENFTDTRQTRFDTIYSGTLTHPIFRDIYAPVDGFVINGGIKVRL